MFKVAELLKVTRGQLISGNIALNTRGISIDSRTVKKGEAFIAIKGGNFDGHDFIGEVIKKGVNCIIVQNEAKKEGVTIIRVKNTVKALGDIARAHRKKFKDIPVIAVTGSNGKTTTKDMIAWVLAGKFNVLKNEGTKNNHIGLPLTLLQLKRSYDIAVLEVGTNHFGEVEYLTSIARPNIGVITNIGKSHLEYFKNLGGVFKEKFELIKNLNHPAIAVLNTDDAFLRREVYKKRKSPFVVGAGIKSKCDFCASEIRPSGVNTSLVPLKAKHRGRPGAVCGNPPLTRFTLNKRFEFALSALGYYNIHNSLLAIAVGRILGLGYRDIAMRLSGFRLPKGRLNFAEIKGVGFIDDTYNSNPLSMQQALGVLGNYKNSGRKILVMGDMLELGEQSVALHAEAIKQALKFVDVIITVGDFTRDSLKIIGAKNNKIFTCQASSEARKVLFERIGVKPGDIVLIKGSRRMKMEEVFTETPANNGHIG
ncbi:MAG: UDP-N-acetylmuramoyl-tripeptide--D-alanyl-D-alanine ligase [Candidatus Omnitrophota bacterium]